MGLKRLSAGGRRKVTGERGDWPNKQTKSKSKQRQPQEQEQRPRTRASAPHKRSQTNGANIMKGKMTAPRWLKVLNAGVVACTRCPRLVVYRERIAREKRRAYLDHEYWGKPVPGFGDPEARVLVLGLAPGAHGSNRTGRPFTGDSSGAFMDPA